MDMELWDMSINSNYCNANADIRNDHHFVKTTETSLTVRRSVNQIKSRQTLHL